MPQSARRESFEPDGLTLGALVAGIAKNPAILLLHGWPHSKEAYDEVIEALAADHRVIAFDLPAIGDSLGSPASSQKIALADLLLGAAEASGAKSPIVVGYDVGGMVAYAAARDHAHRIKGAVDARRAQGCVSERHRTAFADAYRRRLSPPAILEGRLRLIPRDEGRCRAQLRCEGHRSSDPVSARRCGRWPAGGFSAGTEAERHEIHRDGKASGRR